VFGRADSLPQLQEQTYDAAGAGTLELPSAAETAALTADPMRRLERSAGRTAGAAAAEQVTAQLHAFTAPRHAPGNDTALNRDAKKVMRVRRAEDKADEQRCALTLHDDVAPPVRHHRSQHCPPVLCCVYVRPLRCDAMRIARIGHEQQLLPGALRVADAACRRHRELGLPATVPLARETVADAAAAAATYRAHASRPPTACSRARILGEDIFANSKAECSSSRMAKRASTALGLRHYGAGVAKLAQPGSTARRAKRPP
jgi:hypothetical protein